MVGLRSAAQGIQPKQQENAFRIIHASSLQMAIHMILQWQPEIQPYAPDLFFHLLSNC